MMSRPRCRAAPSRRAHRSAARHQAAPFPPAQNPAELYPAPPTPGWSSANPAPSRSRASAQGRGLRTGLLVGAACLAALIAMALIVFVVLPG